MTLGERCDEIVRLIDATLEAYAQIPDTPAADSALGSGYAAEDGASSEPAQVERVRTLAQRQGNPLPRSA